MKKILIILISIIIVAISTFFIYKAYFSNNFNTNSQSSSNEPEINKNSVTYNGWLHLDGTQLKNQHNEIIQLRGVSSHGIEWFSDVITYENLETLKNDWNINVFRIAMYTDSYGKGYIYNSDVTKEKVYNIVDIATQLDMYVIVDWHILNDNNPQTYKQEAKLFFDEVSKKYANTPNVIYEICNEPNGDNVTWEKDVKPYAEEIIPIIRNNSKNSLIIVGTPNWCKNLKSAADNPLNFKNIAYSCHFYSGTHSTELQRQIDYCIEKSIPVFISECGLTDATGKGETYFDKFSEWINYLNSKNLSWIYWSFSDKDESSAILLPNYTQDYSLNNAMNENNSNNAYLNINNYLTDSGKFINNVFKSY